jgi:adenylate kinase family enzyme
LRYRRILVAGISGAGKTTFALKISTIFDIPFFEADALYFGPNWTVKEDFSDSIVKIADCAEWVVDTFGFEEVRRRLAPLADLILWLDYPRFVVVTRILKRSFIRAASGETLWGGNVEHFSDWARADFPVRWAWERHGDRRRFFVRELSQYSRKGRVIRLASPKDAARLLAAWSLE